MTERKRIDVLLTGDSMITRRNSVSDDENLEKLRDRIRAAHVSFTNLEVLPNDFQGYPAQESGGAHLGAHAWVVDDLQNMGFDLVSFATNHSLDFSIEGLLASMKTLDAKQMPYAGVGRNLGEARMPVYFESPRGTVALISCASTFAKGSQAGTQRPDFIGRPGLNPLRFDTTYEVTQEQMDSIQNLAQALGVEQQRQLRIDLGFGFPPDDPDDFPFLNNNFRVAENSATRTTPNRQDVEAIAAWVREARQRAEIVILSFHGHEQGASREEPAEFIPLFARRMIDEGADIFVSHGPHMLRGIELHQSKPIFYSLGNFIAQNDLAYKIPSDNYERFRADQSLTPSDVFRTRSKNDEAGFPADKRYWQTVAPICSFDDGRLTAIELIPISLGFGQGVHRRGQPRLAGDEEANGIIQRLQGLSETYNTKVAVQNGIGSIAI